MLLGLVRNFSEIKDERQQEAITFMARTMAGAGHCIISGPKSLCEKSKVAPDWPVRKTPETLSGHPAILRHYPSFAVGA